MISEQSTEVQSWISRNEADEREEKDVSVRVKEEEFVMERIEES